MIKKINTVDDDLDLIGIIKILYKEKLKIILITLISFILSFFYLNYLNNIKPNTEYKLVTNFNKAKSESLFHYEQLQEKLIKGNYYTSEDSIEFNTSYLENIKNNSLQKSIASEFNNNKDFLMDLIKNNHDNKTMDNIDVQSLAANFNIIEPSDRDKNFYLQFKWHDINQGQYLFGKALNHAKENVKKKIIINTDLVIEEIKNLQYYHLKELDLKLKSLKSIQQKITNGRIKFLEEQANIAKELGFIKPVEFSEIIKIGETKETNIKKNVSLVQIPKYDNRYYLIGYEALVKEIEVIKNRGTEQIYFSSDEYIKVELEINQIKNNQFINFLNDHLNFLKNDNLNNWSSYSWKTSDLTIFGVKNHDKIIPFGIIFGLFIGIFFVLIVNAFRNHKKVI